MKAKITDCNIVELPKVTDNRGNLSFLEENKHLPFAIKRIFYIYDIPSGESRGAHAHRKLHQALICLGGSFEVEVDDGTQTSVFELNRPWKALHIPPGIWASEVRFSPGSICLVICSEHYHESDYIRDYSQFLKEKKSKT